MTEVEEVYIWGPQVDPPSLYELVWPRCRVCQKPLRGDCIRVDEKLVHRRCVAGIPPVTPPPSE